MPGPPLASLARIRNSTAYDGARCDLCGTPISDDPGFDHVHLVEVDQRALKCVCRPCGLLFDRPRAGTLRRVSDRWLTVPGFSVDRPGWDSAGIPVGVLFVFVSSASGQPAAFYPGPAGATESLLPLGIWDAIGLDHPALAAMEPDVEAALVVSGPMAPNGTECFVVPVDACYELTGLLRRTWRGFDGGSEARLALAEFMVAVRTRAGG